MAEAGETFRGKVVCWRIFDCHQEELEVYAVQADDGTLRLYSAEELDRDLLV